MCSHIHTPAGVVARTLHQTIIMPTVCTTKGCVICSTQLQLVYVCEFLLESIKLQKGQSNKSTNCTGTYCSWNKENHRDRQVDVLYRLWVCQLKEKVVVLTTWGVKETVVIMYERFLLVVETNCVKQPHRNLAQINRYEVWHPGNGWNIGKGVTTTALCSCGLQDMVVRSSGPPFSQVALCN